MNTISGGMHMYNCFNPGQPWLDTEGKRIHAHGGSILYSDGVFYWYGENKEKLIIFAGLNL